MEGKKKFQPDRKLKIGLIKFEARISKLETNSKYEILKRDFLDL